MGEWMDGHASLEAMVTDWLVDVIGVISRELKGRASSLYTWSGEPRACR